jgi:predicted DNA binding CopG/RHH family protein
MKTNASEFARDAQKWDDRELGASEEHVEVASEAEMLAFNDALSLQAISIRLQKNLIEDLKTIAQSYGIGYQPMVRDLLQRFVLAEKKQELQRKLAKLTEQEEKHQQDDTVPVDEFIESIKKQA